MEWTETLAAHEQVATVDELETGGLSRHTLRTRTRSGTWQTPAPGVVVAHSGPLTARQRWRVGLAHGGRGAALSHRTAARLHGLRIAEHATELVVPHGRRVASCAGITIHQSRRPTTACQRQGLACTSAPRTVVDVACALPTLREVRAFIADAVQRGVVRLSDVSDEAARAPRHGCRWLRQALDEAAGGVRSAGEAEFMALLAPSGLPVPEFNAAISTPTGSRVVDALWRDYRLAVEIDGREWHLGADEWAGDLRRQNMLQIAGIALLRFPVSRVRDEPDRVLHEVRAALEARGWRA